MGQIWTYTKSLIKNRDEFGHEVMLNFNRNGSSYKTKAGGCLSIGINTVLVVFTLFKVS